MPGSLKITDTRRAPHHPHPPQSETKQRVCPAYNSLGGIVDPPGSSKLELSARFATAAGIFSKNRRHVYCNIGSTVFSVFSSFGSGAWSLLTATELDILAPCNSALSAAVLAGMPKDQARRIPNCAKSLQSAVFLVRLLSRACADKGTLHSALRARPPPLWASVLLMALQLPRCRKQASALHTSGMILLSGSSRQDLAGSPPLSAC